METITLNYTIDWSTLFWCIFIVIIYVFSLMSVIKKSKHEAVKDFIEKIDFDELIKDRTSKLGKSQIELWGELYERLDGVSNPEDYHNEDEAVEALKSLMIQFTVDYTLIKND